MSENVEVICRNSTDANGAKFRERRKKAPNRNILREEHAMKKEVLVLDEKKGILLGNIAESHPIFAEKEDKLAGMLVREDGRWILRVGGSSGCSGFYNKRASCLKDAEDFGYTFFIED